MFTENQYLNRVNPHINAIKNCLPDTLNQQLQTTKNEYDLSFKEMALLELLLLKKIRYWSGRMCC